MPFDVIVVGARVAGSATAMLLARAGRRVLLVDRAAFPSDTISSHQIQVPGVARLRRWGLLDAVRAAGTPPTSRVRFDAGGAVIEGEFPAVDGGNVLYSPRRTVLDALLIDAARAAGAEVRMKFDVESLVWTDGVVTGIRGRSRGAATFIESAPLVVGADGKHSLVARVAGARVYRQHPVRAFASYSYWSGLAMTTGEVYQRPGRAVAAFPTNDGLTMVYTAAPLAEFAAHRGDLLGHYLDTLDRCGDLGSRVRAGTQAERLRTTPDQPNGWRMSHGPGWALVGDAGVVMDSVSAQGITNALRDAELLAEAVLADQPLAVGLARRHRTRDAGLRGMYAFTVELAALRPAGLGQQHLLAAVAERPDRISRFLGAFAGIESVDDYLSIRNTLRLLGPRGVVRLAGAATRRLVGRPKATGWAPRSPRPFR